MSFVLPSPQAPNSQYVTYSFSIAIPRKSVIFGLQARVNDKDNGKRENGFYRIIYADLIRIAPGKPLLRDSCNRSIAIIQGIFMIEYVSGNVPIKTVYSILLLEKGKFFNDLGDFSAVSVDIICRQEGKQLLLNLNQLISCGIGNVKLFTEGKNLSLHKESRIFIAIVNGELITKRKNVLFEIKVHKRLR
jgi:hypothetical protein